MWFCALTILVLPSLAEAFAPAPQELIDDLAAERKHADLDRRRGRVRKALTALEELAEEFPEDAGTSRLLALCRLAKDGRSLEKQVYELPKEQDQELAGLKLRTLGLEIDVLTEEQKKYASDYSAGT